MVRNLGKKLDKIAKGIQQLSELTSGTVYVREGVEAEGCVVVRREYVEAPERVDVTLPPLASEPTGDVFGADAKRVNGFNRELTFLHGLRSIV